MVERVVCPEHQHLVVHVPLVIQVPCVNPHSGSKHVRITERRSITRRHGLLPIKPVEWDSLHGVEEVDWEQI